MFNERAGKSNAIAFSVMNTICEVMSAALIAEYRVHISARNKYVSIDNVKTCCILSENTNAR